MTPDVNVMVAASRDDHAHHKIALEAMDHAIAAAASGASFTLMPLVVASFLRIVTHPKIFLVPTPMPDAVKFVDAIVNAAGVKMGQHGTEWPKLRELCLDKSLLGNALPDAWLASATLESGEQLITFDRDFRKLLNRNQLVLLAA